MARPFFFRLPLLPPPLRLLLLLLLAVASSSASEEEEATGLAVAARLLPAIPWAFGEGYAQLFGGSNLALHDGGGRVRIALDERTGAACSAVSPSLLPGRWCFRALGSLPWILVRHHQLCSHGASARRHLTYRSGRLLLSSHRMSLSFCRFYIDETPIRVVVMRIESMGAQFPSKPMSLYTTIWDGSSWATSGGRYKVDYKYAPFVAELTDLTLHGCTCINTLTYTSACSPGTDSGHTAVAMSGRQWLAMERLFMTYGYCYDIHIRTHISKIIIHMTHVSLGMHLRDHRSARIGARRVTIKVAYF
ncbi:putative xyloglucan endotransglucosylase/hydrolase protein 28 [Dichanthelium oligosanthes]|uniref:Putative xyloglucan endotransglucosylase/hydrolase protein 28 n=1 Tax=Dichanthelium oligosanthes TaxID=888268 RepID=A0A1E5VXF9_9POAL|nr:putative xyloglucan endotransglucosylase/hydrolase protein 28 [Dichanthelium oligosanthes]